MVSLGRHSTYMPSEYRDTTNQSKSTFQFGNDYTTNKQKAIITSLYCTSCSKDYPPN
jgi:hypothetical protein